MIIEIEDIDMSKFRWITVKKKDSDKGRHVLVTRKDGIVVAGLGDRFVGKKIDDIYGDDFDKIAVKGEDIHNMFNDIELTENEEKSIRHYTGPGYSMINRYLRKKERNIYQTSQRYCRMD